MLLQEDLRPYFALPKVMDGLFSLANRLFGVSVEPADGLAPVSSCFLFFSKLYVNVLQLLTTELPFSGLE